MNVCLVKFANIRNIFQVSRITLQIVLSIHSHSVDITDTPSANFSLKTNNFNNFYSTFILNITSRRDPRLH